MAKKKAKPSKKVDDVPEGVAATAEELSPQPAAETISKAEAVRKALAAGKENPTEGSAFIKAEFKLAVSPAVFSTYKAAEKKRSEGSKPGRKPKAAEPAEGGAKATSGDTVEFVRQVKELVNAHGVAAVKQMVDVFTD